jgi:hypothetical protein
LVSNDTGAIHVAASEDVRVLGLFGKNALFRETAPWGVGHVILQLPYGSGMDELPVGVAIQAAAYCLGMASEGEFAASRGLWSGSVWETYWLSDSHDRMGGVGYRPLSGKENVEREAWAFALRSAFPRMVSAQPSKTDVEVKAVWSGLRDSLSARRDSELESMARGYLRRLEGEAEGALGALTQGDFLAVRAGGEALIGLLQEFKERVSWHAPMALIASYVDWRIRCLPEAPADVILAWTSGIVRKADALICEAAAILRQVSGGGIPREGVSREEEL